MRPDDARRIVRTVLHEIAPDADLDAVRPDETLQEALGLDSLDFLHFVEGLHAGTGIEIPEREYPRLLTVEDCVAYVTSATRTRRGPSAAR